MEYRHDLRLGDKEDFVKSNPYTKKKKGVKGYYPFVNHRSLHLGIHVYLSVFIYLRLSISLCLSLSAEFKHRTDQAWR